MFAPTSVHLKSLVLFVWRNKRRVIVIRESFLWGLGTPHLLTWFGVLRSSRFQGYWIQDVMERLSLVFWLLCFAYIRMATSDLAKGNPEHYQEWLKNSEGKGEGHECKPTTWVPIPVRERDLGRSECVWLLLKVGLWLLWPLSCPWGTRTAEPELGLSDKERWEFLFQ